MNNAVPKTAALTEHISLQLPEGCDWTVWDFWTQFVYFSGFKVAIFQDFVQSYVVKNCENLTFFNSWY